MGKAIVKELTVLIISILLFIGTIFLWDYNTKVISGKEPNAPVSAADTQGSREAEISEPVDSSVPQKTQSEQQVSSAAENSIKDSGQENSYEVKPTGALVEEDTLNELEDSGIVYENRSFSSVYYPYYEMLNSNEKLIYNQLYANIEGFASKFRTNIEITREETERAYEAVYNDHPELFWLNSEYSYMYMPNGLVAQIILSYNITASELSTAKAEFEKKADAIINNTYSLETDFAKEKYVHDALVGNIEYDVEALYNQSAYSALVIGRTVCAGYARAFQYIMTAIGIPAYYVTGYASGEPHSWNIVCLDDGYYNVDLTWDDGTNSYSYFNLTDSVFSKSHQRSGLSENLAVCDATDYSVRVKPKIPNIG